MANCPNCGAPVADNAQGCNACGRRFAPKPAAPAAPANKPTVSGPVCEKIDIDHNRGYAFISYFGILCLVPLFFAKHSKFARYHCNQGILVALLGVAMGIVTGIIGAILGAIGGLIGGLIGGSAVGVISIIVSLLAGGIGFLGSAAVIALIVFGLINVFKGRCKPVPVIGKIVIFKY